MAGTAAGAREDRLHPLAEVRGPGQQRGGIEVALHADVGADGGPAGVERHAPVEPDDVAAGLPHERQQRGGPGAEVNRRHAGSQRADHRARVRQHVLAIVVGPERADPGVEELDRLRAGVDLAVEVRRRRIGQHVHQAMPGGRGLVHQALRVQVVARGAALDDVGRDGERLAPHEAHGLEDRADARLDVDRLEPRHVGLRAHRAMDDRPFARGELEPHAEGLDEQQDVGEEDGRVDTQASHRLQRDLGRRLRIAAQLEKAVARAHRAVLGQVATGLPHEPHRGDRRRLTSGGAQQERGIGG